MTQSSRKRYGRSRKALRAATITTPVIFLTAIGGVDDRVEGLEAGADDYLTKPFAFSELVARLGAISRRPQQSVEISRLEVCDLEMDLIRRRVTRAGHPIDLLTKEFQPVWLDDTLNGASA